MKNPRATADPTAATAGRTQLGTPVGSVPREFTTITRENAGSSAVEASASKRSVFLAGPDGKPSAAVASSD